LSQFPDEEDLYNYRAQCYTELRQYELAFADSQKCIDLNPNATKGYYRFGRNALSSISKTY